MIPSDIAHLTRLPIARLTRPPRAWLSIGACFVLPIAATLLMRDRGGSAGPDRALLTTFGALALPILAYATVGAVLAGEKLSRSGRSLVALGASPFSVAAALVGVGVVVSATLSAVLAATIAAAAHRVGGSGAPLGRELVTCAWIGALGGGTYAAFFAFGGSFGARGGGRAIALAIDWILGSGAGLGALLTPRAQVRNLLGGAPAFDLSQRRAAIALFAMIAIYAAIAIFRAKRGRFTRGQRAPRGAPGALA